MLLLKQASQRRIAPFGRDPFGAPTYSGKTKITTVIFRFFFFDAFAEASFAMHQKRKTRSN
jgi:hypothetical protein